MNLSEMNGEQRRQMIDAKQVFEAWRAADQDFRHKFRGSMRWRRVNGAEYLYRIAGRVEKSMGRRTAETERIKDEYTEQRARIRQRRGRLAERLKGMDRLNRAYGIARMPTTAAAVLRALDAAGLLGKQLHLVGTHSLYAYEARTGVLLGGDLTATQDVDLLLDARQRLSIVMREDLAPEGLLGLLRSVDRSFARRDDFRAVNDEGYLVDLIAPFRKSEASMKALRLGDSDGDLAAASILGLEWLINAPKLEEVVIGADGRPLWVSCIDPRAFALHKFWVSKQNSREPIKRRRDVLQARAVAVLAADYMGLEFKAKDLTALPLEMVRVATELVASARRE